MLGERMAASKKKKKTACVEVSVKNTKKCFHSELATTNRLTIPD